MQITDYTKLQNQYQAQASNGTGINAQFGALAVQFIKSFISINTTTLTQTQATLSSVQTQGGQVAVQLKASCGAPCDQTLRRLIAATCTRTQRFQFSTCKCI